MMMVQNANHAYSKHPERGYKYEPYPVQVDGTLMISSITLLVILIGLLVSVPMNKWILSRKIGWTLIAESECLWQRARIILVFVLLILSSAMSDARYHKCI
jgi:sodium/potassium/calcium exchanger 6